MRSNMRIYKECLGPNPEFPPGLPYPRAKWTGGGVGIGLSGMQAALGLGGLPISDGEAEIEQIDVFGTCRIPTGWTRSKQDQWSGCRL